MPQLDAIVISVVVEEDGATMLDLRQYVDALDGYASVYALQSEIRRLCRQGVLESADGVYYVADPSAARDAVEQHVHAHAALAHLLCHAAHELA